MLYIKNNSPIFLNQCKNCTPRSKQNLRETFSIIFCISWGNVAHISNLGRTVPHCVAQNAMNLLNEEVWLKDQFEKKNKTKTEF